MTDFFLICFLVGLLLSVIGALTGSLHMHFDVPHLHVDDLHLGDAHADAGGADGGHGGHGPSVFNFGTIVAFLAWFGAAGYLLTHYSTLGIVLRLGAAAVCGLAGAAVVFWFLMKLAAGGKQAEMHAADYEMVGVLGKINSPIRKGGTGEIVYSQDGARHCAGARSETGAPIPKGTEVVVTRYEKGIAYVRPWEELANE